MQKQLSPWVENVRSPTNYRLGLARVFSHEGRNLFGDRWKGIYVLGSTASRMACHLKDVDVLPLVEKSNASPTQERELWVSLRKIVDEIERNTGVFIEVWANPVVPLDSAQGRFTYVEELAKHGAETIPGEALLLGNPIPGLPRRVEKPGNLARYSQGNSKDKAHHLDNPYLYKKFANGGYSSLRGETPEAFKIRFEFEMDWLKERKRHYALAGELLPRLELGEWQPWIAAFSILDNFIPLQYEAHNRLEFLVAHEPLAHALIGFIPLKNQMQSRLMDLIARMNSDEGQSLREKLLRFNEAMNAQGLVGIAPFVLRDNRAEWDAVKNRLKKQ